MSQTAWGGRFDEEPDALAMRFSASVHVDQRLATADIRGSIAHVTMLSAQGIVSEHDAKKIIDGLNTIQAEIDSGEMVWSDELEDVHMNIEARLVQLIGDVGGRLHTGRSRNDQVATDMRIWTRHAIDATCRRIDALLAVVVVQSERHVEHLMPGYTHLQRAQPVRLAHHLLAWAEMFARDRERLQDARGRLNECPLGCAALASTTFNLDREWVARELEFDRPTQNSLDTTADRDFLFESVSALSLCALHLSRVAEELVLWSSQEFGFVAMSDAFTTGSSIMPQKKNPDMAELVRGKSGRVVGNLVNLALMLKALPLAYNRDMQEDKPPVFEAFDTVQDCLDIIAACVRTAEFDKAKMSQALKHGFVDATEVADWLAERGVPFREAHHVTGRLVRYCATRNTTLSDLSLEDFRAEHEAFDETVFTALNPEVAVERRTLVGGPARAQVQKQIARLAERLEGLGVDLGALRSEMDSRSAS